MGESTAFVCLTHQQYPRQAAYAKVPEVWRMCVGNIGRSDPSLMVLLPLSEFTAVQSDLILIHFELLTHCPQCCLHGNSRYHFSKVLCLIKKHRTRYTILKKTPKKQNKTKTNKKNHEKNPWKSQPMKPELCRCSMKVSRCHQADPQQRLVIRLTKVPEQNPAHLLLLHLCQGLSMPNHDIVWSLSHKKWGLFGKNSPNMPVLIF